MMAVFRIFSYADCDAREKTTEFSKYYSFTGRTILIVAQMKDLSIELSEKSELQHRRDSILFALLGIPEIWGSQNDIFQ